MYSNSMDAKIVHLIIKFARPVSVRMSVHHACVWIVPIVILFSVANVSQNLFSNGHRLMIYVITAIKML